MAAYRPLGQFPQFLLDNGLVNAGGYVYTYETDLTTPKLTWSDPGLTIENPNPIPLTASGTPSVDVWGDGSYGMTIADADNVVYRTANNIQPDSGATQTIPPLADGFLTNDLTNLLWQTILQVPDPTGYTNYILSNDGANPIWIAQQTLPDLPVSDTSTTVRIGSMLMQVGSSTAPATNNRQTSVSVTFPQAYDTTPPIVLITPTNIATSGLQIGVPAVLSKSTTGFTVQFDSDDFGQSNASFTSSVNFDWQVWGVKAL